MNEIEPPIARNPLRTKSDMRLGLQQILDPLAGRYVLDGAGLHLGDAGVRYSPRVAALEGWSRVLWGIAPLIAGGGSYARMSTHLEGFRRGVDPDSPDYWGTPPGIDQRLVEMAAMALTLMLAPEALWEPLSRKERENAYRWLSHIETQELPDNNWHFFRVMVCSAFRKLGLPVKEEAEAFSLERIDSMYRGDGWYQDGVDVNYDYYNPFGFHFYGLIYAKLMGDRDPERAARFRERARLFAGQFLPWFREDGALVPYGRSLAYRFGAVSFFSACAFAEEDVIPWGEMKGIVLRNLRSWFARPIFDVSGLLTVGHGYSNLIMAEQYNSPTSPYWALKAFLPLALAEGHPFWAAKEAPMPALPPVASLQVPKYVVSRSAEDVFLLCPGRYPGKEMVQAAAKFSKFAYSARFGFCVSHGAYGLEKTGCDSMLVLSERDGYWRERRQASDQKSGPNWTSGVWKPWFDVEIETILVAMGAWHARIHRIVSERKLESVEGGFSVPIFRGLEPETPPRIKLSAEKETADAAVAFPWAASRIVDAAGERHGEVLNMEPNLNILFPTAMVPVLRGTIEIGRTVLACAVRGGDADTTLADTPPRIEIGGDLSIRVFAPDGRAAAIFGGRK